MCCGKRFLLGFLGVWVALGFASSASAGDVGQEVADQIDQAMYQHYLDDLLYTHDGDSRGSAGVEHDLARDNIAATFENFGLQVLRQYYNWWGEENIIATQVGTKYPDMYYLIGAHYDSVDNPGADDNGSGVALVMEVARVLSQYETEYTIKYVAFDLEEEGLYGSYTYVDVFPLEGLLGMISIDMVAFDRGDYACTVEYAEGLSVPWVQKVTNAVNLYGGDLTASSRYEEWGRSDHAPFESAGVPACCVSEAGIEENPCYHEPCDSVDTPDYISYDYATDFARGVAGLLAVRAVAYSHDCNENGVLDVDEIAADATLDCNLNGKLDTCEFGDDLDCNSNGVSDICDIFDTQTSEDCDGNNIPDECEDTSLDCNGNGMWDACDVQNGVAADCNANFIPDECDVAAGTSGDCNADGILDECELALKDPLVEQIILAEDALTAMVFVDPELADRTAKLWDDFTLEEATRMGRGEALFTPGIWGGSNPTSFLVEIADAPGGAEVGANVVFSTTGTKQPSSAVVEWDFENQILPAGTWWLSVQAPRRPEGISYFVEWWRTNHDATNGSEHFIHNPGGGLLLGTEPVPASTTWIADAPADLVFTLVPSSDAIDCNTNGVPDHCDIRDGVSYDANANDVPDECEDSVPPQPDPMCFDPDALPRPLDTSRITMTAAVATDDTSGVEYRFAAASGVLLTPWQEERTLVVSGLNANWPYSYKVKARDTSLFLNETAYTTPAYHTATAIETPSGIDVSDVTATSLRVQALGTFTNLNFGESGLYFELTPPVENSGANEWTSGSSATSLVLNNLLPCTEYTLRVKARNFYGSRGGDYETPWTEAVTITTTRQLAGDCNCDNKVDYDDIALLRAAFGTSLGDANYDANADVDGNGAIDCDDWQLIKATWTGRRAPLFEYCCVSMPASQPKERATGAVLAPRR